MSVFSNQGVSILLFFTSKTYKLMSCNVHGIVSYDKRSSLFNRQLHREGCGPDIFALQETHITDAYINKIRSELRGPVLYSQGTVHGRGVMLGFSPKINVEMVDQVIDSDGRYIVAKVRINNEPLTVVTVYLEPTLCVSKCNEVFASITAAVNKFENNRVIYCGDFNCIIDSKLDSNNKGSQVSVR